MGLHTFIGQYPAQETKRRLIIVVLFLLKINGNHDVGTHLAHNVDRKIIDHSTIHQHHRV